MVEDKIRQIFLERGDELAEALFEKAVGGDMKAMTMIRELSKNDREAECDDIPDELSAMSDEQLRRLRNHLMNKSQNGETPP